MPGSQIIFHSDETVRGVSLTPILTFKFSPANEWSKRKKWNQKEEMNNKEKKNEQEQSGEGIKIENRPNVMHS